MAIDDEIIMKAVPKVYDDGIKSTVQESGKVLSLIPKSINAALLPLRKWIEEREYKFKETQILLESKLKQVDPDKIVSPEAYVAIPALESLSYSMDSVELRNLYANLLANAMNKDVKEKVHPAFVEIIRQLTPNEAKLLEIIFKAKFTPVLDLELDNESGTLLQQYNFTWITEFEYEEIAIAINNFERIGLIEIPFIENYVDDKLYECVRVTQTYNNHKEYLEKLNKGRVEENKKIIKKTALGVSFFNVCVSDN